MNRAGVLLIFITLLWGCSFWQRDKAPYLVSSLTVMNGESVDYLVGAVEFHLINQSDRDIISVQVEFDVYDTAGLQQPSIGNNHVESTLSETISGQSSASLQIILDSLFTYNPAKTLTITRFCITKIVYSDGSMWHDSFKTNLILCDEVMVETQ